MAFEYLIWLKGSVQTKGGMFTKEPYYLYKKFLKMLIFGNYNFQILLIFADKVLSFILPVVKKIYK